ncbi:MAG: alpha/beta hydrolase [Micavibrio aeruginosavorus]|uniref:Alpha/beta hydrolase n=1 Tax=Micavibrio aeruginosavorus TaxID=349221 RepID=A0A2W5MU97_9BACT|nr:MAG: alpha/beta hydrolase [Micavibrio aeruginosavorus]
MNENPSKDLVVILHGIGMTPLRMAWLDFGLRHAGFETLNLGYPSLKKDIAACAAFAADKINARKANRSGLKTHFVTHSMGSLVALELMQQNVVTDISRAVLIAPPYRGSEVADLLAANRLYRRFFGPAGQQLTTAYRKSIDYDIPKDVEIGVIAGTRAYEYPFFLSTMKKTGVHDGLVSLASTTIPGIKDHITIRMSHSFLLEKSVAETVHFLRQGRFSEHGIRQP